MCLNLVLCLRMFSGSVLPYSYVLSSALLCCACLTWTNWVCWCGACACNMFAITSIKPECFMFCSSCAACVGLALASSILQDLSRCAASLSLARCVAQFFMRVLAALWFIFVYSSAAGGAHSGLLQSARCHGSNANGDSLPDAPMPFLHLGSRAQCV